MSKIVRAIATIKSQIYNNFNGADDKDIITIAIQKEQADAVIEALEKQILQPIMINGAYEVSNVEWLECPNCSATISELNNTGDYCYKCGQKLDMDKRIRKI